MNNTEMKNTSILRYIEKCQLMTHAHYYMSIKQLKYYRFLNAFALVSFALVTIYATYAAFNHTDNTMIHFSAAILAASSLIISGIQSISNFQYKSLKHRDTASKFSIIRREIEHIYRVSEKDGKVNYEALNSLILEADRLTAEALPISDSAFRNARTKFREADPLDRANAELNKFSR